MAVLACEAGGPPRVITALGRAELQHVLPQWLPGGAAFLYTVRSQLAAWGDERVVVQRLASGERRVLVEHATDARVMPTGQLAFMRLGTLAAVPFDAQRRFIAGGPIAVVAEVAQALTDLDAEDVSGAGQFAVSADGLLACLAPLPHTPKDDWLRWIVEAS